MPTLTEVKETKRGRFALFFDGEFAFSLDEETYYLARLHEQDVLEQWDIDELRSKSDTRKAIDKALDLLSYRDHASGELYQKLCRKFDPQSSAAAVAKAQELGLLDDARVALRRAAELHRKHKSRREILNDLSAKGFDREDAAAAVEQLYAELAAQAQLDNTDDADATEPPVDPEITTARTLVERKYAARMAKGERQKVAAALARHGFSHAVIREVLDAYEEESLDSDSYI